ncbi:MAG TPA: flavin reductase [Draconibacterium sp.]|nr:flavin reductase [Draconibacterium sp.]
MKRPWNIPNLPVYSVATYDQNGEVNMNIATYVSAVSMQPKKIAVAIFKGTKSFENMLKNEEVVLQLLHASQFNLIKKLGQTSGYELNKFNYLNKKELLETWLKKPVLKNVSSRLLLKKMSYQETGDHWLYVFDVLKTKTFNQDYLDTSTLSEKKIIRI